MASALLAGSPGTAFADTNDILEVLQNSTVRGKVVDASGEPVIGASVVVKGTTTGVITDLDGNFILNNVSEKATLVISYVGYKTQEIALNGRTSIHVTMQENAEMLDELVVVGYGAMKKSSLTGAVAVVDNKMFKDKSLLDEHYGRHGQEIADVLGDPNYSMEKYLDDANYIVNNGTYVPELNGYVSFMNGKKYGFVGLDRATGDITTFHIKNISELIKKAPSLGFGR